jgi:2'-5' RNA ligase
MRLFAAVWPSPPVVELLGALDRPDIAGLRWTGPEQWHVTLVFLGERDLDATRAAFRRAPLPPGPVTALAGPATGRFGRRILHVPVEGLDDVAASVRAVLPGDDDRPFRGHLTLARARERRGVDLSSVVGLPLSGSLLPVSFSVAEVTLVASRLGRPARYEVVDRLPLPEA